MERGTAGKSQQSKKSLILAQGDPTLDSPGPFTTDLHLCWIYYLQGVMKAF